MDLDSDHSSQIKAILTGTFQKLVGFPLESSYDPDEINNLSVRCLALEKFGIRPPRGYDLYPLIEWKGWVIAQEKRLKENFPWFSVRRKVLERDNYKCKSCGKSWHEAELHVHHIIPISIGGPNIEENLITLCSVCHLSKTHKKRYAAIMKNIQDNYTKYHKDLNWGDLGWG